jgi:hypothetical protein
MIFNSPRFHYIFHHQSAAIKARIQVLGLTDVNPNRHSVEAAYRYLVRSHGIIEAAHGSSHPSVATGCLAVASVQNILEVRTLHPVHGFVHTFRWTLIPTGRMLSPPLSFPSLLPSSVPSPPLFSSTFTSGLRGEQRVACESPQMHGKTRALARTCYSVRTAPAISSVEQTR